MADSKFAGLRTIRQAHPETEAEPPNTPPDTPSEKGRGRPTGKRSNPDWKLYSHFLKKQTQRAATNILRNEDEGRDLSDLLQELLDQWIAGRKPKGGEA